MTTQAFYVLVLFMSAETQLSAPTPSPDPSRAAPDTPSRIGRVLTVVRKLIGLGRQLAATIQQRANTPDFALLALPFGTTDIAIILARIINGLRRAAALETELSRRAARGQDLTPTPLRAPSASGPRQAAPPDAPPEPQRAAPIEHPHLARLPTEDELAAEVRRRPVGAVIVDICHDLGIAPGHLDRAFWDELAHAIIAYGGSLSGFFISLNKRLFSAILRADTDPAWPASPQRLPVPATGPP